MLKMNKNALSFYFLLFAFSVGLTNNVWACSVSADFNIDNDSPVVNEAVTITYNEYSTSDEYAETWEWNFGEGAVPATANTVGPHQVYYNTFGQKSISLHVTKEHFFGGTLIGDSIQIINVFAPAVSLPHTFRRSSGSIDVNNDGEIDFIIEYLGSGSAYMFSITGVNDENKVLVEPVDESFADYVSILPYLTLIEYDDFGDTPPMQGASLGSPAGSYWSNEAIVLGMPLINDTPLQSNTFGGAEDGYIGVYYNVSGSNYTGWLHYQYVSPGEFIILSAGSATGPNLPVAAGFGDPFGNPVVPVSIIGSLIALLAIGGGSYLKRKRKK